MPGLTGSPVALSADIFSSSADQAHQLGAFGVTRDGRKFRYCKAGATLVVGHVIQSPAQITGHQNLTPTVTTYGAIGDTKIQATFGATACAANLYADGWAVIDTTPGLGYAYPISAHAANTGTSLVTFTLQSDSPVQVALTASSRVTLVVNPYKNVIQSPATTLTGIPVGVAVYPIASGEYGWLQVAGPGAVLVAAGQTPALGNLVSVPAGTAGAVAINSGTLTVIGTMMVAGQASLVQPVLLNINA